MKPRRPTVLRGWHAALLLPAAIFVLAWFWGRPQLCPDTATGLNAWRDFTAGGPWNTVLEPSPTDLATDIARPITWWSPGQYVAPGLFISAGLSPGASFLVVALLAAWSFTWGLVRLGSALGASEEALPWIAFGAAGGWHTLYAFGFFVGGEVVLAAVWPWIFLAGWRLRHDPAKLVLLLPPLLLLGSFAKHSFAIYALGLLAFLSLEAVRGRWKNPRRLLAAIWPLALTAVLYAAGRALAFPAGPSPSDPGQATHTMTSAVGFSAFAPLFASTGGGSLIGRFFSLATLPSDEGWRRLGWLLAVLSPLPLWLYLRLARDPRPLHRLAGITCLVTFAVLAALIARGGSISLEDRHYRPAGALLLVLAGLAAGGSPGRFRLASRLLIFATVVFGVATAVSRHQALRRLGPASEEGVTIVDCPADTQAEIRRLAKETERTGGVLYLPYPPISLLAPAGRVIATDARERGLDWIAQHPFHGRVPLLTLVLPVSYDASGRGAALRASFLDWNTDAWSCRTIGGWNFWSATAPRRTTP